MPQIFTIKRIYVFKYQDRELERVDWDIELDDIYIIKGSIAITAGCYANEIDMEVEELYIHNDLSKTSFVNSDGQFMHKANEYACFTVMNGVRPAFDLEHEILFEEFLDLIEKKEFDKALIFN